MPSTIEMAVFVRSFLHVAMDQATRDKLLPLQLQVVALASISQVITQPLQKGSREPVEKHRKKLEESDEKSESFGIL